MVPGQRVGEVPPLETLFIFGTNRNALHTVIGHLDQESKKEAQQRKLLIPIYRQADRPMAEERKLAKFEITANVMFQK